MFKNIKTLLSLPVIALALTSCNSAAKTVTYDEMREFAVDKYDKRALDTISANYTTNLNTMQANIVVDYEIPGGGSDSFTISFGFNGIHVLVKDQYAICLSSSVIDMIEKYYSDFVGIALSLKEEPPVTMNYQLMGGDCTKIDVTTSEKIVGSTLVKFLKLGAGTLDLLSSATGYIPTDYEEARNPIIVTVLHYLDELLDTMGLDSEDVFPILIPILDYIEFTISDSSESHGEVFDTYLTTDSYGFINKLDFNFKSSFTISGLASYKRYEDINPKEGARPIGKDASYRFTLTGSVDFDFDITSEIVR